MKLLLEEAKQVAEGVWIAATAPHELTMFNHPSSSHGRRSVLLTSAPLFYAERGQLVLDPTSVDVMNVGTSAVTVVIDVGSAASVAGRQGDASTEIGELGPGDREFYLLAEQLLDGEAQEAAIDLIRGVRQKWPGDLKRGERNNFSNTPDNFWYVIIQPRVQALSVTIRGKPEQFTSSQLKLTADRPGYTRFSISSPDQIPEALHLIEQSKRK